MFSQSGPKIWNLLPKDIRLEMNIIIITKAFYNKGQISKCILDVTNVHKAIEVSHSYDSINFWQ